MSKSQEAAAPDQRGIRVRYEVQRERRPAARDRARTPVTEEFYGLDRARLSAFSHALDGTDGEGSFSGVIRVVEVRYVGGDRRLESKVIDVIDERVAFRFLNEVRLPRPEELAVSKAELEAETFLD